MQALKLAVHEAQDADEAAGQSFEDVVDVLSELRSFLRAGATAVLVALIVLTGRGFPFFRIFPQISATFCKFDKFPQNLDRLGVLFLRRRPFRTF